MTTVVRPLVVSFALSVLAVAAPTGAQIQFTDVSATAGITLPDTLTESAAWGDYDNDGDLDLYLTNDGPNALFRNDGGDVFTDVTDIAGVGHPGFSVGTGFADLDNDGDLDLYVVSFGIGPDALYRNDGPVGPEGACVFTDVTVKAGTTIERSSRGMAYVDFDRDGLLDIYVNAIGDDILYHNLGGLQFEDAGRDVLFSKNYPSGQGVGVVPTDVNNDGRLDLYNGNRSADLSNLFINQDGASFEDVALEAGIVAFGLGMGVHAFDYDNDLDMDLYWTTWPGSGTPVRNALYQNQGDGTFIDVAVTTGTDDPLGWGISNNAGDIDNDRWEDFFVTNGFSEASGPNVLFRNVLGASFQDVTAVLTLGPDNYDGRGVAFADYDRDGDLDLILTGDVDDDNRLWRNDTITGNHWVVFELVGRQSNRSAVGARLEVTAGGATTVKEVSGGAGRGSFNSLPVEFGLATAGSIESVFIRWPSGRQQALGAMAADQYHQITEPLPGDVNDDGVVDVGDLLQVIADWGPCGQPCLSDTNGDGAIDVTDLIDVIGHWSG